MTVPARQITTTPVAVTGVDSPTTISARIVTSAGRRPDRAVTAGGAPVLPAERSFHTGSDGLISLRLVPTTLMDEADLRWRLEWPGGAQPLDIAVPAGDATTLDDLLNTPSREVPAGGSTGDHLAKASGDDYDTEWQAPPPTVTANPDGEPTGDVSQIRVGLGNPILAVADTTARAAASSAQDAATAAQATADSKRTAAQVDQAIAAEVLPYARDAAQKIPVSQVTYPDRLSPADLLNGAHGGTWDYLGGVGVLWQATGINLGTLPGDRIILRVGGASRVRFGPALIAKADIPQAAAGSSSAADHYSLGPQGARVGRVARSNSGELLWAYITDIDSAQVTLGAWGSHQLTGYIVDQVERDIGPVQVTQATVYPPAKAILRGSDSVTVTADDTGETLTLTAAAASGGLPSGWAASKMLRRNSANDGWDWIDTPTFTPTRANLYSSVKAMLATAANTIITATGDDDSHELDLAVGAGKLTGTMLETLQTLPTPGSGDGGKAVALKSDRTAWELVNLPSAGTGLPAGYAASEMLRRNAANDGWDWISTPTFTPTQANLYASVKAMLATTTNAVVKVAGDDTDHELDLTVGDGKLTKTMLEVLQQLPTPAAGDGGKLVAVNSGRTSYELVAKPADPPAKGTATPKVESGAGKAGTAASWSPEDHVHPARTLPTPPPTVVANPAAAGTVTLTKLGITPSGGSQTVYTLPSGLGQSNVGLTQIFAEDVTTAATSKQFVEMTNGTDALTDWFYLHLAGASGPDERYVLVRLADITALTASTAGSTATVANAVIFNDLLAGNGDLWLGRTAAGNLLIAANKTSLALNVAVYKGTQVAGQFVPSQANLYASVKAMLATSTNTVVTVTGDDSNHELDLGVGAGKVTRAMLTAAQQLPAALGSGGQVLAVNSAGDATEWAAAAGLPSGYAASKMLRRNTANDGWDWIDTPTFTPSRANLYSSVKSMLDFASQSVVTVTGKDLAHELGLGIGAGKVTGTMLEALQTLPTPSAGDEGKIPAVKSDRSGWELVEDDSGDTPTQSNVYPLIKDIFKLATDSATVEGVAYTDDDTAETTALSIKREIIGDDWGNLPVGFAFSVGRVVSRSGQWYIAIKAHTKGAVGPDNDSTNWEALTDWTGAYSGTRWYHAGQSALLTTGHVAIAKADLSPNATEPTVTDASWWVGGSAVEANKPLQGSEQNLTSLEVAGTLYSLNVSEESAFKLEQVSAKYAVPTTLSFGTVTKLGGGDITPDDLDDVLFAEVEYTRSPNDDLKMTALIRKAEIPVRTAAIPPADDTYKLQAQGAGGDFISLFLYDNSSTVELRAREGGTGISNVEMTIYNVAGVKGEKGDKGDDATITADTVYPVVKPMVKAGDNVTITPDDTSRSLAIGVRLPDEAAPRVYALDSRDVRTVQPPYSYDQIWRGFNLDPGTEHVVKGAAVAVHDRDSARPGFQNDFNNGRRNSNGVDFTNTSAGTTDRNINVSVEVEPANERSYSNQESLTLRIYTYGRLKPKSTDTDNHLTFSKVFQFVGGYQDAFTYDFALEYSGVPRSGEHDSYRLTVEWETGSSEVVRGVINAVKETFTLPALGSIPTQKWTHHSARLMPDTFDPWIPAELKPLDNAAAKVATWAVGTPNNTGKNAPNESDKADVTDPLFTFAGSVLDKPFLRAEQDLSRVKLHFAGQAVAGGGDAYLCTRIQGFPAEVLANTSTRSAWTIDYTAQGAMALQDFYVLDPSGTGLGSPTATWDANPGGPKINNVIDGIFHTAHLVAGINYTPVVTHEFSIDDDQLNEAAEAGLLHVIRIYSNDVVAEIPLRGIPRPVPFGSGATNRVRLGTGHLKPHASQGGASTIVWVNAYRDNNGMHFVLVGTDGTNQNAYVSGAEIEYARYET